MWKKSRARGCEVWKKYVMECRCVWVWGVDKTALGSVDR
jgi:hypothetical protein